MENHVLNNMQKIVKKKHSEISDKYYIENNNNKFFIGYLTALESELPTYSELPTSVAKVRYQF